MTDPEDTSVLSVTSLTKRYRKLVAVDDLTLSIEPGEFVGFIGPNGAGKSTTMNCVAGTLIPDDGEIRIGDVDVLADTVEARRHLGFVPQELDLYGFLTGEEYLRFVADLRGVTRGEADEQLEDLLELTELTAARNRLVKEYSGGMSRKLAICSALIGRPKLLLLDESFVGLDPESTYRIRRRLETHCESGGAILLSSHILDMMERICSRIVMLVDGQLRVDRSMEDIHASIESGDYRDLTEIYLTETGKQDLEK